MNDQMSVLPEPAVPGRLHQRSSQKDTRPCPEMMRTQAKLCLSNGETTPPRQDVLGSGA